MCVLLSDACHAAQGLNELHRRLEALEEGFGQVADAEGIIGASPPRPSGPSVGESAEQLGTATSEGLDSNADDSTREMLDNQM